MSDDVLVRVENVSKKFCRDLKRSLWYGVKDLTSELLGTARDNGSLRREEFWAVKDVSFDLKRGECLGLIGHNGAGKSTLLKMLNGLIKPDQGTITIKGRVGALIELGAGFNPILTGRENVYVNGQILGFTKQEIEEKFDDIVEFAEIPDFIDMPVQNYSSGMKVRLGFAIAAQMEPDVLIIDEVLAVGDVGFRTKCYNLIAKLIKKCAVILVSHTMPQIARISSRVILMKNGIILHDTVDVSKGIEEYYNEFDHEDHVEIRTELGRIERLFLNVCGVPVQGDDIVIKLGSELEIKVEVVLSEAIKQYVLNLIFFDQDLKGVAQVSPLLQKDISVGKFKRALVTIKIPELNLSTGMYSARLILASYLGENRRGEIIHQINSAFKLRIAGSVSVSTPVLLKSSYLIEKL